MSCGPIGLSNHGDQEYACPKNALPTEKFRDIFPPEFADENADACISFDEFASYVDQKITSSFTKLNRYFFTCAPISKHTINETVEFAFKNTNYIIEKGFETFIAAAEDEIISRDSLLFRLDQNQCQTFLEIHKANYKFHIAMIADDGGSGLGIQTNNNGEVVHLEKGSGAEIAGIRLGDRVLRTDGTGMEVLIYDAPHTCAIPSFLAIYRPFKFLGFDFGKTNLMQTLGIPASEYGFHNYIVDRLTFSS